MGFDREVETLASAAASPATVTCPSISFVVATENDPAGAEAVLRVLRSARTDADEVLLLTRADRAHELSMSDQSWLRVIGLPDPSVFTLRAHVPAHARKEWVVVLEEHSLVTAETLVAVRETLRSRRDIDLIAFLAKNLTSTRPWGWTNFLHNFTRVWAPISGPPPFAPVTAAAVRRAALQTEQPLRDGEWELYVIPHLFAGGRYAYSNEMYFDHVKPLSAAACLVMCFHNARAGAGLGRTLGRARRDILREGWFAWIERPPLLMAAAKARRSELPRGMRLRLRLAGFAHLVGNIAGILFGAGRSGHKLD